VEICQKQKKKAYFVTCDRYVTLTDGTGVVHIAPAFGEDDANVGRNYDLPFVQLVDGKGEMTKETPWEGVFCKKADPMVLQALEEKGLLFAAPKFEHSYPHCWRCDTPLIYYARESWFIRMTAVKDELIANNNTVNWIPESIGKGRFGDWLENVQDWGISRNRYWGTPLNVWECSCGHMESIGSRQELLEKSGNEKALTVELHRPYIDEITMKCPECGGEMHRVSEVIDCWFDSGAMPFAQHHYPFENKEIFESQFPAKFISEAVDQTRGWFYSLMAESTLLFNKSPFENVIVMGHVQDENGQKMSKSKGNAVDPFESLEKYGADANRWYFYTVSAPWIPKRYSGKAVMEGQRKFMSTLWNSYAFFVLYANIDDFNAAEHTLEYDKLPVMDKLYTALVTIAKAAAPMIPFMTEDIYRNLVVSVDSSAPESVHLCDFPVADETMIDEKLEADMKEVLEIVVMGRACRNNANIKNRQPIGTMFVKADKSLDSFYQEIIEDELNVKKVAFTDDVREFTSYTFKPQLRTVGPKYGKQLGGIRKHLEGLDGNAAMDELNASGALRFDVDGTEVELAKDDLLIEMAQKPGYVSEADNQMTVVLDTNLTDELVEEGFVYEVISKIQTMRKDAGFEVMDHIRVSVCGNDRVEGVVMNNRDVIAEKVLADEFVSGQSLAVNKEWNVNGETVTIGVEKV